MNQTGHRYSILDNRLAVGDAEIVFDNKIYRHLEISDMLILLMIGYNDYFPRENVFGVSIAEKRIKWRIEKREYYAKMESCPFVGIRILDDRLILSNWCDTYLVVDPQTGKVLEEGYSR